MSPPSILRVGEARPKQHVDNRFRIANHRLDWKALLFSHSRAGGSLLLAVERIPAYAGMTRQSTNKNKNLGTVQLDGISNHRFNIFVVDEATSPAALSAKKDSLPRPLRQVRVLKGPLVFGNFFRDFKYLCCGASKAKE